MQKSTESEKKFAKKRGGENYEICAFTISVLSIVRGYAKGSVC